MFDIVRHGTEVPTAENITEKQLGYSTSTKRLYMNIGGSIVDITGNSKKDTVIYTGTADVNNINESLLFSVNSIQNENEYITGFDTEITIDFSSLSSVKASLSSASFTGDSIKNLFIFKEGTFTELSFDSSILDLFSYAASSRDNNNTPAFSLIFILEKSIIIEDLNIICSIGYVNVTGHSR